MMEVGGGGGIVRGREEGWIPSLQLKPAEVPYLDLVNPVKTNIKYSIRKETSEVVAQEIKA